MCYLASPADKREAGGVLVLFALTVVVLIIFIAFAVDFARISAAAQRQSRTAELAALYAMEAYIATDSTHADKLVAAAQAAERVGMFEYNRLMTSGHDDENQISAAGQLREIHEGSYGTDIAGTIEAGAYFFARSNLCDGASPPPGDCPCGLAPFNECFRPHDPSELNVDGDPLFPVTAFRVTMRTRDTTPIEMMFGSLAGVDSVPVTSQGLATIVPRHAVFIVDMTPTITLETHTRVEAFSDFSTAPPADGYSENAFELKTLTTCDLPPYSNTNQPPTGTDFTNGEYPPTYPTVPVGCSYPAGGHDITPNWSKHTWDGNWQAPTPTWADGMEMCRDGAAFKPTKRFRDDYVPVKVDTQENGTETCFFVERNNIAAEEGINPGNYYGPQPLARILQGVRTALDIMADYTIPGDTIALLAIDNTKWETRLFGPTGVGQPEFQLLGDLTDMTDISAATVDARIQRGLFVRTSGTDLPEALLNAYGLIANQPLAEIADNFVVMFTDGLPNCTHFDGPACAGCGATAGDPSTFTFPTLTPTMFMHVTGPGMVEMGTDATFTHKACNTSADSAIPTYPQTASWGFATTDDRKKAWSAYINEANYRKSLAEVQTMVTGQPLSLPSEFPPLAQAKIKLHTFLFGAHVQPHLLVKKGLNEGCLNSGDAKQIDEPLTEPGTAGGFFDLGPSKPFLDPNYQFQYVIGNPTGGQFVPVMPPCNPVDIGFLDQSSCELGGTDKLNDLCDTIVGSEGTIADESSDGTLDPAIVDGRLICDPSCRDEQTQINEGIARLFRDNPIMLVRPGAPPVEPPGT